MDTRSIKTTKSSNSNAKTSFKPLNSSNYSKKMHQSTTSQHQHISTPVLRLDTKSAAATPTTPNFPSSTHRRSATMAGSVANTPKSLPALLSPAFSSPPAGVRKLANELRKASDTVPINDEISLRVPSIIHKCCEFILNSEPCEGIFRINGAVKKVKMIESEIQNDIDSFEFKDCIVTVEGFEGLEEVDANPYDVAMILKRWLSNLENGLLTSEISQLLKDEYLSLDQQPNEKLDVYLSRYLNSRESLQRKHHQHHEQLPTPSSSKSLSSEMDSDHSLMEADFSVSSSVTDSTSLNYDSEKLITCSTLAGLPIQNLHLFIYLLRFLHRISQPGLVKTTKMTSSNLAKIFQLSFFKSDDLIFSNPLLNVTKAGSTDNLLENYRMNEDLLKFWIDSYPHLIKNLKSTVDSKNDDLQNLLSGPMEDEIVLRMPKTRATTDDTQKKRKSIFGYRSLSNAFSSSSRNLVPQGSERRIVSESSATPRHVNCSRTSLTMTSEIPPPSSATSDPYGSPVSIPSDNEALENMFPAVTKSIKRKSFGWFNNSNMSAPALFSSEKNSSALSFSRKHSSPKLQQQQQQQQVGTPTRPRHSFQVQRPFSMSLDDLHPRTTIPHKKSFTFRHGNISGESLTSMEHDEQHRNYVTRAATICESTISEAAIKKFPMVVHQSSLGAIPKAFSNKPLKKSNRLSRLFSKLGSTSSSTAATSKPNVTGEFVQVTN